METELTNVATIGKGNTHQDSKLSEITMLNMNLSCFRCTKYWNIFKQWIENKCKWIKIKTIILRQEKSFTSHRTHTHTHTFFEPQIKISNKWIYLFLALPHGTCFNVLIQTKSNVFINYKSSVVNCTMWWNWWKNIAD